MYENERDKSKKTMISLADSFLSICTNVDIESNTANIIGYKFNLLTSSIEDLFKTSNQIEDYLSTQVPGLSIKLADSKMAALTTLIDMANCINNDMSVITNYTSFEELSNDLREDLLHYNDVFFEALERATIIYNKSN